MAHRKSSQKPGETNSIDFVLNPLLPSKRVDYRNSGFISQSVLIGSIQGKKIVQVTHIMTSISCSSGVFTVIVYSMHKETLSVIGCSRLPLLACLVAGGSWPFSTMTHLLLVNSQIVRSWSSERALAAIRHEEVADMACFFCRRWRCSCVCMLFSLHLLLFSPSILRVHNEVVPLVTCLMPKDPLASSLVRKTGGRAWRRQLQTYQLVALSHLHQGLHLQPGCSNDPHFRDFWWAQEHDRPDTFSETTWSAVTIVG